ncbi:MAG: putative ABC exporter domain-containing protein, partial [Elusimicrobiota bacterium]|nr:putative ABC exporter domain-containing protein [Elusimicrobiota bacterium]
MFKNFLRLEIRSFINRIKFVSWTDSFKSSFLLLVGFIFLWLLYQGFFRILVYLNTVEFIGGLLIIKLMSMIMLTFFVMLIFSNLIISFSTIYFSNDLDFLVSMPVPVKNIFIYKFIKTTFFSSWMVLLVFLPFLFAYGKIKFTGFGFYVSILLLLIPFFLIASSIGTLISTVFMRLFPSQKMRDIFIILGVVAVGVAYLFARFIQPEDFLKADKLEEVVQYISVVQMPTAKYLPSWWVTSVIFLYVSKQWSSFFIFSSLLIIISSITIIIVIYISDKLYYDAIASSRESTGYKFLPKLNIKSRGIFSVFVKDIKIFFRDTGQWSQLL